MLVARLQFNQLSARLLQAASLRRTTVLQQAICDAHRTHSAPLEHQQLFPANRAAVASGLQQQVLYASSLKAPLATTTPTGLQYLDLEVGTGETPVPGDVVSVHYTGSLLNGTKFDSSVDRGVPLQFHVAGCEVIKGWDEGIASMRVGGKRKLVIPPHLAYGARGADGVIPPNATLVFEVDLIKFRPPPPGLLTGLAGYFGFGDRRC